MTISNDDELEQLKEVGRIVANAVGTIRVALEPGITTSEFDAIGKRENGLCYYAANAFTPSGVRPNASGGTAVLAQ